MTKRVLVADANREFGILIRQSLEEDGEFQASLVHSGQEAVERAAETNFEAALIDLGLPDIPGAEVIRQLQRADPKLTIIAIPLAGSPEDLEGLNVAGILTKPFYLPDLPGIFEKALSQQPITSNWIRWQQPKPKPAAEREVRPKPAEIPQDSTEPDADEARESPAPDQLQTPAIAASPPLDLLQRGTKKIDAIASLLWDGDHSLICAGLSRHQLAALEAKLVELGDELQRRRAITLYIELPDFKEELLLFASPWNQNLSLATLHSVETPFRQVRRRSQDLGDYLRSSAVEPTQPEIDSAAPAPSAPKAAPDQEALPEDWVPEDKLSPAQQAALNALASMEPPPPDPDPWERQSPPPEPTHELPDDWIPTEARSDALLAMIEETVPAETTATAEAEAEKSAGHLKYSLVLIPRFPGHQLASSLFHQLERWVQRICLAWDWQAEEINVADEYLHLALELNPSSVPAEAADQLKSDLSRRILEAHPEWAEAIPSGRFFAQPHLLTAGTDLSRVQIQAFVETSRRTQGRGS